ncbi:hypothetical protein JCGZ_09976 [Jatropha curcas]|uniref:Uncharacterized protein n=1 Tax=Jatropha curcas TaxID=180498 RepID=A0A067KMN9_JATCU|nr:hypothetical protein JCGZ_09976 [Jatropha curcas]
MEFDTRALHLDPLVEMNSSVVLVRAIRAGIKRDRDWKAGHRAMEFSSEISSIPSTSSARDGLNRLLSSTRTFPLRQIDHLMKNGETTINGGTKLLLGLFQPDGGPISHN